MAQYDFLKEITNNHYPIKTERKPIAGEYAFPEPFVISADGAGEVTLTALNDFADFLNVAFGIKAVVKNGKGNLNCLDKCKKTEKIRFETEISENGITISGDNDRSVAQGVYYLEFCVKENRVPALKKTKTKREMLFSPRMVHSAYGVDEYPDGYLSTLAHYGYDAILVFTLGVDETPLGKLDFNELCARAAKFGIDVYAYCEITNFTNPAADGAEKIYDELYGSVFKACPALKGMVFVGESVEFLSNDEHVVKHRYNEYPKEGIPENKPSPGWWPCKDYAQWISLIRDSIRRYKTDADVVFWTYNWGWAPEKDRLALINSLPTDISLLVTFEMFQKYEVMGVEERVSDYSLTRTDAGEYFLSEAKAAKERGIRLYSMVNTAGRTWDFGTIPYLPMPYAWIKRYKAIKGANKLYGLTGLMEGHHYGMFPSFIARLTYLSYYSDSYEENLNRALNVEYGCFGEALKRGLKTWSEAIKYLPPTIEEQYGPLRTGTIYPLCLIKAVYPKSLGKAYFGDRIWSPMYGQFQNGLTLGYGDNGTPYCLREKAEIRMLAKMAELMEKGIAEISEEKDGDVSRLINMGKYIKCCVLTVKNVKEFYGCKMRLMTGCSEKERKAYVEKIKEIAAREIENARESAEYLKNDSMLGYEPSMLYVASPERVEWKIEQVKYMLKNELPFFDV